MLNFFSNSKFKDEDVNTLVALGFSKDQAKDALKESKGNVEVAANMLISMQQ